MTKEQAIKALKKGLQVRHITFQEDAFVYMEDNLLKGSGIDYNLDAEEFWGICKELEKDWEIYPTQIQQLPNAHLYESYFHGSDEYPPKHPIFMNEINARKCDTIEEFGEQTAANEYGYFRTLEEYLHSLLE